jgi:hypothetical protein
MIAGGSALTVALQVCHQVLKKRKARDEASMEALDEEEEVWHDDYDDEPRVTLVLCNHTRRDVIFRDHFASMLEQYPNFNLVHCISTGPVVQESGERIVWRSGHLNTEVLRPAAEAGLQAVVSGPPGLCKATLEAWVALGRSETDLKILDELPDDTELPAAKPREMPRKVSSSARRERRERAWRGKVKQAAVAAAAGAATPSSASLPAALATPTSPSDGVDLTEAQGFVAKGAPLLEEEEATLQDSFFEATRSGEVKPLKMALERMWRDVRSTLTRVTPDYCQSAAGTRTTPDGEGIPDVVPVH